MIFNGLRQQSERWSGLIEDSRDASGSEVQCFNLFEREPVERQVLLNSADVIESHRFHNDIDLVMGSPVIRV